MPAVKLGRDNTAVNLSKERDADMQAAGNHPRRIFSSD